MYTNSGGARLTGGELEWEQSLLPSLKLDGNISYADTDVKDTGDPVPKTANLLANIGLSYEVFNNLFINTQYRYVGRRNREPQDTRSKLDAFHTVDVTVSLFNLFKDGLTLRAGIKNILDGDVRYAAPMNTYSEDYPQSSQLWWTELSNEF